LKLKPVRSTLAQESKLTEVFNFSCVKMILSTYVLCSLRLFKLKTAAQATKAENFTEKSAKLIRGQALTNPA